jgi:hypothetical protein
VLCKYLLKTSVFLASILVPAVLFCNAQAEAFLRLETKLKYDNNLANGQFSQDLVGDMSRTVKVTAGKYFQLSDFNSLSLSGNLGGELYNTYHGLNNVALGGSATLKRKWGLGLYQPWTALSLSSTRLDYNSEVRDGWQHEARLSGGKRITEHWDVWADFSVQKRSQDDVVVVNPAFAGNIFDMHNKVFDLGAVYAFDENTFLTLAYQWQHGDVQSTSLKRSTSPNLRAFIVPVSSAISIDDAFGAEARSYRLDGKTQVFGAAINTTIYQDYVLGLEYQRIISHADGDNNYYKSLPAITLSYEPR